MTCTAENGDIHKLLVVARTFPPVLNPSSILIGNLLRHFPTDSYCVLTGDEKGLRALRDLSEEFPHYTRYEFSTPKTRPFTPRARGSLRLFHELMCVLLLVAQGIRIIKKENVTRILATFPHVDFLLAAYWLHCLTGKPFFVYLFDPCGEVYAKGSAHRTVSRFFEERILRVASTVFVMSEALQEHLATEHGIEGTVVFPQPMDLSLYAGMRRAKREERPFQIAFTGDILDYVQDAVVNMARVANRMENVQLVVYCHQSDEELAWRGVCGRGVVSRHVPRSRIPHVQAQADALFLPMAFKAKNPFLGRVGAPTKMGEYLAAGRPILVHAPPDSYVAWYARQHGFALQVNQKDLDALEGAVLRLMHNTDLGGLLVQKAQETVQRHNSVMLSKRLQTYLCS